MSTFVREYDILRVIAPVVGRTSPSLVSTFVREYNALLDARRVVGRTSPSLMSTFVREYDVLLDARRAVGSVGYLRGTTLAPYSIWVNHKKLLQSMQAQLNKT